MWMGEYVQIDLTEIIQLYRVAAIIITLLDDSFWTSVLINKKVNTVFQKIDISILR
jgi:hypothetical protein